MKGFFDDFKSFISRGKVVDFSIGVILGSSFSKVFTSIVSDIIMPSLSFLFGDVNFKEYKVPIGKNINLSVGNFIDSLINLILVLMILFLFMKLIEKLRNGASSEDAKNKEQINLLTEIRDLLKSNTNTGNSNGTSK